MNTEDRHALAFLGWLLLACLICWAVVIGCVWLVITVLMWLGSGTQLPTI